MRGDTRTPTVRRTVSRRFCRSYSFCGHTRVGDTGFEPVASAVSRQRSPTELIALEVETGFEPVYTALQAVASPLGHSTVPGSRAYRADDGIRTRDPHLGKVMRYQLRYIRTSRLRFGRSGAGALSLTPSPWCEKTISDPENGFDTGVSLHRCGPVIRPDRAG